MKQPLVSIVIPAYNHGTYVEEAVRSVLGQDYPNIELIVIDDGSTDETSAVLDRLPGTFTRKTQLNQGQAKALKSGWELADGDFIGYLSADDTLAPSAISKSIEALAVHPNAVVSYCDFNLIDPKSRVIRSVKLGDFNYIDMLTRVSCPIGPGAIFHRDAYNATGPWNSVYRQMPDFDFWLRLGLRGSFIHISESLANFRVHPGSQTYSQTNVERANEPVKIVTKFFCNQELPTAVLECRAVALSSAYLVSAQLHLRAGRIRLAMENFSSAFSHSAHSALSLRSLHLLFNAIFNRAGHRIVSYFKSLTL
jgi:glycosyltransferase involved in cell wall biosynthesis